MSLVKKLKPGGTVDNALLDDASFDNYITSLGLPTKQERLVRDAYIKLKGKNISIDHAANQYTISGVGDEITSDPNKIGSNIFTGKPRIKDEQGAAAFVLKMFHDANPITSTPPINEREKVKMGDFKTYMVDKAYGTPEGFESEFRGIKKDEDRQKTVFEQLKTHLTDYVTNAEKNKSWADYTDLEKVKELQLAVNNGNWEVAKKAAYPFGLNLNEFLVQPSEKATFDAQDAQVKVAAEKQISDAANTTYKRNLLDRGFNSETADKIISSNYKLGTFKPPTDYNLNESSFNDYLLKNKGTVWDTPNGQMILDENMQPINEGGEKFDIFHPLHGLAWENTSSGLNFPTSKWVQDNRGEETPILGTIPGFDNATITGISNDPKNPNYVNHLRVNWNKGAFELIKGEDGVYRSPTSQEYQVNLTGFGKLKNNFEITSQDFPEFINSGVKLSSDYQQNGSLTTDYSKLQSALNIGFTDNDKIYAHRLRTALTVPGLIKASSTRNSIIDLLNKARKIFKTPSNKQGGVLKMQIGNALQRYRDEVKQEKTTPVTQEKNKTVNHGNITGTWAGQDTTDNLLDAASIAGTAGSFVPVYGAIGAGISLGADLAKDLRDKHIDNPGTHLLNLAFVGLSFVGLGGLKAVVKGAKIANGLKGAGEIEKIGSAAAKYATKMGIGVEEGKALEQVVKLADKIGAKTPEQFISKIAKLKATSPAGSDFTKIDQGLEVLSSLAKGPLPVLNNVTLGRASKIAGNTLSKISSSLTGKVAKRVVKTAIMVPGTIAATKVIPDVLRGDIEYTKPGDWKAMAATAGMGTYAVASYKQAKAFKRQTLPETTGENSTVINIPNEKPIMLKQTVEPPIQKEKGYFTRKVKREEANKVALDKFKKDVATAAKEEGVVLRKGELDPLTMENFVINRNQINPTNVLGDVPKVTPRGRVLDVKDFKAAKKYEKRHFIPSSNKIDETITSEQQKFWNNFVKATKPARKRKVTTKKQGGILKLQSAWSQLKFKPSYSNTLENTGINYNTGLGYKKEGIFITPQQPKTGNYYGGVTNELIAKNWDPIILKSAGLDPAKVGEWGTNVPEILQKYVYSQPNLVSQLKNPENRKFGIDQYTIGLKSTSETPREPITREPSLKNTSQITTISPSPIIRNGTKDPLTITTPWIKSNFDWGMLINPLTNTAMFANTTGANINIGNNRRMGIAASLFQKPYMPQTYLRLDKPNSLFADKMAGDTRFRIGRTALMADLDKSNAIKLQGENQANEIMTKGHIADLARFDQVRNQQLENRTKIDQYNTGVLGENKAMTAAAFGKIYDINAAQTLMNSGALNNYLASIARDIKTNQFKWNQNKTWNMMNDPNLKTAAEKHNLLIGEDEYNKRKAAFEAKTPLIGIRGAPRGNFEDSSDYTNYQRDIKNSLSNLEIMMQPLRYQQAKTQFNQNVAFIKKGGKTSLTVKEQMEIDNNKESLRYNSLRKLKDTEMAFKSILHNNEMLQRSLTRIFK